MRISFIGSGQVATHLAQAFAVDHQIVQVIGRNLAHATCLAKHVGAEPMNDYSQINAQIDLLVIAVSDQAISKVIEAVHPYLEDVLIVHTSGSTDIKVLSEIHSHAGVFYPLQSFSFGRDINWASTPLFIEATQQQNAKILHDLANSLSKHVYAYSSSQRLSLHLAAVFACNFSNYCYDAAKQILDQQQVDFALLFPLILETAKKATEHDPVQVQTGPAVRHDQNILNKHEVLLEQLARTDLKEIYQLISQSIIKRHEKI